MSNTCTSVEDFALTWYDCGWITEGNHAAARLRPRTPSRLPAVSQSTLGGSVGQTLPLPRYRTRVLEYYVMNSPDRVPQGVLDFDASARGQLQHLAITNSRSLGLSWPHASLDFPRP
jgi:hypothetical protein